MANADDKVMAAVESALKKDPNATVDDLFAMAKGINSSVGKLSKRQFHARYPLQVKRRSGGSAKPKAKKKTTARKKPAAPRRARPRAKKAAPAVNAPAVSAPARDSVRAIFLRFASDLAAAEARKDVVKVVAGVDRYVNDVLKATAAK